MCTSLATHSPCRNCRLYPNGNGPNHQVFHHATFFLNGVYLMTHECGYTGFDLRLDNATNIRFGPGIVLPVRVIVHVGIIID